MLTACCIAAFHSTLHKETWLSILTHHPASHTNQRYQRLNDIGYKLLTSICHSNPIMDLNNTVVCVDHFVLCCITSSSTSLVGFFFFSDRRPGSLNLAGGGLHAVRQEKTTPKMHAPTRLA
uniref:Uncharacterized protein n=1 Tax=Oryza brachyantha TaxID=4533 RepID=J3N5K1_ORYBR